VQVAAAVFYCLLAAGIVFGYAAIKPVLVREKVYRNLCTQDELDQDVRVCFQQEIRLNLMFTTAAVGTNVAALPIGAILDNFGPKVCGLIGSVLLTIGSLLFAFAGQLEADVYIVGYLFLALGGPFIFISSFQLSNTFPKHSGFILALLTGAFDTSSAVFLLYRVIYQNTDGALKPKHFFLLYLVVPAFIFIVQILLMPSQSYETVGELLQHVDPAASTNDAYRDDQMDETTALLREEERLHRESVVDELTDLLGSKRGQKQVKAEAKKQEVSGVWGVLHGQTVVQQITSPWFILITLFTVIQMTRINYFVATIRAQYEVIFGSYEKAVAINEFFDVMLPLGGVLSIPFIGTILDRSSTLSIVITLVSIATTIGVLGILPYDWAAYANVILFTLYRPFYYTAVSDYSAKVFGFRTFGTVYGLIICLAGLFNFSQSLLDTLTHKTFHNDPRYVNVGLLGVALLVGVALAGWVGWKARGLRKEMLAQEAEEAEEWEDPVAPRGGVRGRQE
jgi:MFS family permease